MSHLVSSAIVACETTCVKLNLLGAPSRRLVRRRLTCRCPSSTQPSASVLSICLAPYCPDGALDTVNLTPARGRRSPSGWRPPHISGARRAEPWGRAAASWAAGGVLHATRSLLLTPYRRGIKYLITPPRRQRGGNRPRLAPWVPHATRDQLAYLQAPASQSCERGSVRGGLLAIRSCCRKMLPQP